MKKTKVFCIPYAGGSSTIFEKWKKYINNNAEIIPLELNGRGILFDLDYYADFTELLEDLYKRIKNELDITEEFIIFGHSMGAYATYFLENMIEDRLSKKAKCIFVSGREAPQFWKGNSKMLSNLNDEDFLKEIVSFGGMQEEVLNNKEIMEMYLPILRNDFNLIESINFDQSNKVVNCKIVAMNGTKDKLLKDNIDLWGKFTTKSFESKFFDGSHFYINEYWHEIVNYINKECK